MGFFADIASLWGTGQTADELEAESRALDDRLAGVQRTREVSRPDLFATEDYRRDFNAHLEQQRRETDDISESIEREFNAGFGGSADQWKKVLTWLAVAAVLVAVLYLFGPAIRKKFANA